MNDGTTGAAKPKIVERVKAILIQPKSEWEKIAGEPESVAGLYRGYVIYLAALPAIAGFLRAVIFGYGQGFGMFRYRPSITSALVGALVQYVVALVGVAVIAFIANVVARKFDGKSDQLGAFKLAAYGMTAGWLAGVFELVPGLGWLSILGVYSFYLVYLGLPVLLQVPRERAFLATLVIGIASVIVFAIGGALLSPITRSIDRGSRDFSVSSSGSIDAPGIFGVNTNKIERSAKRMEQAAEKARTNPVNVKDLEALVPERLAGYSREKISSSSMGLGEGGRASTVTAVYGKGDERVEVKLIDMSGIGAMAQMGAALGINSERRTEDGFERVSSEDGTMTTEKWNERTQHGSYSFVVADRFTVSVEGDAGSLDDLKTMAHRLDLDQLEDLAG